MEGQASKIRTIRQGGKACPFCGGQAYQLALRRSYASNDPALLVRCHQCHHARDLDTSFQERLWL